MSKIRHLYSRHTDVDYVPESIPVSPAIEPNDCAVTDSELMRGRVVPSYHGTFTKFEAGLHPFHRRGVDFTDVGNILAGLDAQEESTAQKIKQRREEITKELENSQSEDQN